ncbi:alpha/beta fold hydrolase [Nocardia cyriacigeorgica]|uniref:alpha/beta fold hydrolase n=1 Tax=Nocardia cyriacigeorgica TaxID=135487 RepID=UPI001893C3A6|nr:alpha/beta fold hydrolase [Nocardia cyriacigeorgica]MBF6089930.1 alpha/beta fold hydrolase [Nocardia cyriacigeorgica]MBF6399612.1 alpha/beta fold hydrolase [Nocardia cyriacigeorgica]MBF6405242.1 alpha/beta fold hydrolase [Nocardia cyriacigeorgica]
MQRFQFETTDVAYLERGSGPAVVLLHNAGSSHVIWRAQIEALARERHVYALDLFGYGESGRPADGYTLDRYADMIEQFLADRGIASAAFVGNCLGSAISLTVARRSPHLVDAVVACNPLTESTALAGDLGLPARLARHTPAIGVTAVRALTMPRWAVAATVRLWFSDRQRFTAERAAVDAIATWPPRALLGLVKDLKSYAALEKWSEADLAARPPVCTIWGRDNRVLSAEAGLVLNRQLRPARAEFLDRCGHVPMLERPDEVTSIVREFLDEHVPVNVSMQGQERAGH